MRLVIFALAVLAVCGAGWAGESGAAGTTGSKGASMAPKGSPGATMEKETAKLRAKLDGFGEYKWGESSKSKKFTGVNGYDGGCVEDGMECKFGSYPLDGINVDRKIYFVNGKLAKGKYTLIESRLKSKSQTVADAFKSYLATLTEKYGKPDTNANNKASWASESTILTLEAGKESVIITYESKKLMAEKDAAKPSKEKGKGL